MEVRIHPEAAAEIGSLSAPERESLRTVMEKLEVMGMMLRFPDQSHVRGGRGLRELRPRGGRSRWRLLYRRREDTMLVLALAPEAMVDRRGFAGAIAAAHRRYSEWRQV